VKKVTIILNDFSGTGVPRVTTNLANGHSNKNCQVKLIVLNTQGAVDYHTSSSIEVINLDVSRSILALPKIITFLIKNKQEAVIAAEDQLGVIAALALTLSMSKAKLLITSHVPISISAPRNSGIKAFIFRAAIKLTQYRTTAYTTVSQGLAEDLKSNIKFKKKIIKILNNPVIDSTHLGRTIENKKIHPFFDSSSKVLVAAGSLHKRKGFHDLIEAFSYLEKKRDIKLIIIGKGIEKANLIKQIEEKQLSKKIALTGFQNKPLSFFNAADLFILPSYFEGLPTVLIEALAKGCPCVATDCLAGPREILLDGKIGTLVPVGNPSALAKGIEHELSINRSKTSLINRAQDFTIDRISQRALELLFENKQDQRF